MDLAHIINDDETICYEYRLHWIILAPIVLAAVFLNAAVIVGAYILGNAYDRFSNATIGLGILGLAALAALSFIFVLIAHRTHTQNRLIVTDKSLYQVTRSSLLSANIYQSLLIQIENVSAKQHGLWATLLGYGDLMVITAGERENFMFKPMSQPEVAADQIIDLRERTKQA